jgi:hypothetical protein
VISDTLVKILNCRVGHWLIEIECVVDDRPYALLDE